MPRIPSHKRQRVPSGRVGGVPIPSDIADVGARTRARGLADLGRGIGNLGKHLFQVAEETAKVRSETQYLEGASIWERQHTKFLTDLARDQDFESYGAKYEAFATSLRDELLSDKRGFTKDARRYLQNYITKRQPEVEKHIAGKYLEKQADYSRASTITSIESFEKALDADGAIGAIDLAVETGFMSAEEAAKRKLRTKGNVDWYTGLKLVDTDPAEFGKLCDADADGEIDYDFLPNLAYDQKVRLRNMATVRVGQEQAKQDKQKRELAAETESQAWNLWRDNELTHQWIEVNQDALGPTYRDRYTRVLDLQAAAEAKQQVEIDKVTEKKTLEGKRRLLNQQIIEGKINPESLDALYFNGLIDEDVWTDMRKKAEPSQIVIPYESLATLQDEIEAVRNRERDADSVKELISTEFEDWLKAGVAPGKATAKAENYRSKLSAVINALQQPDNVLNRPAVKRGFSVIDRLRSSKYWVPPGTDMKAPRPEHIRRNLLKAQELSDGFERWVSAEHRTDKQIEDKILALTIPERKEIVLEWWEKKLWWKEEENQVYWKRTIEQLGKDGIWGKLTGEERDTVLEAMYNGASYQDVVNAFNETQ